MKPHRLMLCLIVGVGLAAFVGAPASAADCRVDITGRCMSASRPMRCAV